MVSEKLALAVGIISAAGIIVNVVSDILEMMEESKPPPTALKEVKARVLNPNPNSVRYGALRASQRPSRSNSSESRYPYKIGVCRICSKRAKTHWHHIISQHRARKIGRVELIDNPGNMVEICRDCHSQTTSWMSKQKFERDKHKVTAKKHKRFWNVF